MHAAPQIGNAQRQTEGWSGGASLAILEDEQSGSGLRI